MTTSRGSRNGRRPAAWGWRNGEGARTIPAAVRDTQARASDPAASALRVGQCRLRQDPCAGAAGDPAAARRRAAGKNPLHHLHQGGRRQHGRAGVHHARPLGHARRRRARRGDPRGRHRASRRTLAQGGAQTVRLRAGDAGRAEGADHPRAVHAAAAAISVRGQCAGALCRARRPRPERDDGARQPRRAARGLAQSRQRDRPRADDGDGERRRRHLQGRGARGLPQPRSLHGLDRMPPAARRPPPRRFPRRSASSPTTASRMSSARSSMDRTCRDRDGRTSRWFSKPAARPIRTRRRGCAARWCSPARRRSTSISAYS